ncbi:MAG: hypothetical protein AB2375_04885 [Tissierellaceae bacterium]
MKKISGFFNLVKIQTKMNLISMFRYKMSLITEILLFVGIYIMIIFSNDYMVMNRYYGANFDDSRILVLIGYLFWQISSIALGLSSSAISNGLREGTLEMKTQGNYSLTVIYFIDTITRALYSLIIIAILIFITMIISEVNSSDLLSLIKIIPIMLPSIVGMFGIGLVMSGFTLMERNISQVILLIQGSILILSTTTNPSINLFNKIIPFVKGVDISRNIYLNLIVNLKDVFYYLFINFLWVVFGHIIFNNMIKRVRYKGSFTKF